jgi:hypothetical protein
MGMMHPSHAPLLRIVLAWVVALTLAIDHHASYASLNNHVVECGTKAASLLVHFQAGAINYFFSLRPLTAIAAALTVRFPPAVFFFLPSTATLPHTVFKKFLARRVIYLMCGAASVILPLIYLILRSGIEVKIGP